MSTNGEFDAIVEHDAAEKAKAAAATRRRRIDQHLHSMRVCWPEWKLEIGGRCEVGIPVVHSLKHDGPRYRYCAPCVVREISADGETIIAEIHYAPGTPGHCIAINGERLRLDITEVWVPVAILHPLRYPRKSA